MRVEPVADMNAAAPPGLIAEAVRTLDDGGLVACPAGGRYALLADALDDVALENLFAATGRPADARATLLSPDLEAANHVARVTQVARELAARHLPGDVVVVLPARATAPALLTGAADATGAATVGVRVPPEALPRAVAATFGPVACVRAARWPHHGKGGLDAASAGALSPLVRVVADAGAAPGTVATVVTATGDRARVIRAGAVPAADLDAEAGE